MAPLGTNDPVRHSSVLISAPSGLTRLLTGHSGSVLGVHMGSLQKPSPMHVAALQMCPGLFRMHDRPSGTVSSVSVRQWSCPEASAPCGTVKALYLHPPNTGEGGSGIGVQDAAVHSPDTHVEPVHSCLVFRNSHLPPVGISELLRHSEVQTSAPSGDVSTLVEHDGSEFATQIGMFHTPSAQVAALHVKPAFVSKQPAAPVGTSADVASLQFGWPVALAPSGTCRSLKRHPGSVITHDGVLHGPPVHIEPLHV